MLTNFRPWTSLTKTINDSVCFTNSSLNFVKDLIVLHSTGKNPHKKLKDNYSFRTVFAPEVHHLLMCAEWFCIHSGGIVIQRFRKSLGGKTQLDCREGACNQILPPCNRVTGLVISPAHDERSLQADFSQGHPGKHDLVQKEHTTSSPASVIIMRYTLCSFKTGDIVWNTFKSHFIELAWQKTPKKLISQTNKLSLF